MEAQKSESFETSLKAAFALHNAGRHAEAEALCRTLLDENAHDGQLLFLLGMILQKTGRSDEALKFLEMAAALPSPSARIFNGLGFVHQSRKEYACAWENYERAIAQGWRAADTFYSAGNACYRLGEMERAVTMFQKAVELKPSDAASWNNLGKCLNDLNRLPEAIAAYDRAVAVKPDYALAHYGRAIALLTAGRLAEGFREYNQWRHCGIKPREFSQPAWRGQSVPDKILFLHAEQGFGDAIQNVRFIPQVRERVANIILECRPELRTLFVHSGCADEVIAYGETIPPFDCFTSLASLPGILGVTLATIPQPVPYLKPTVGEKLLSAQTKQLKIGLAWAGNPTHHNDAARSLRLEELMTLLSTPGTIFYSLQQPVPTRDEVCFQSVKKLLNSRESFNDFLETSALVAEMDLIITVDTAIAHLAGALAKPVWTLLPFAADWRWFLERTDTPWYPTMRLFRQKQRGQWHSVIAQMVAALNDFSHAKKLRHGRRIFIKAIMISTDELMTMFACKVDARTELRLIDRQNTAELSKLFEANREHLRRWHPWVDVIRTPEAVEKAIINWQQRYTNNQGFHAGIWFDHQFCGVINHVAVDWPNHWAALGYWLDSAHQGKGIMTACVRTMIAHSFETWKLNRIMIECATENIRSRAIAERLGFKLEGITRQVEWIHDRYVDHAVYGLVRADQSEVKQP